MVISMGIWKKKNVSQCLRTSAQRMRHALERQRIDKTIKASIQQKTFLNTAIKISDAYHMYAT